MAIWGFRHFSLCLACAYTLVAITACGEPQLAPLPNAAGGDESDAEVAPLDGVEQAEDIVEIGGPADTAAADGNDAAVDAHAKCPGGDCDDGNLCTTDSCDAKGACLHVPNSAACDDDDVCTVGDKCFAGKCTSGSVKSCADSDVCTKESCDKILGCLQGPATATCDDDNLCTQNDVCQSGDCQGEPIACDDGNLCTNDGCEAASGCYNIPNALACADEDTCTTGDMCKGGKCAGVPANCSDQNPCTTDTCVEKQGCIHSANVFACDDGDPCTVADTCAVGACSGVTATCDDDNLCTNDSCVPPLGCAFKPNALNCDDQSLCTVGDVCAGGKCAGKLVDCDDKNPCTNDSCAALFGCVHAWIAGACDDESVCTSADVCVQAACVGKLVNCDDKNACTDDSCDAKIGCVHKANAMPCSNLAICIQNGVCAAKVCVGKVGDCDDKNVCTDDSCDFKLGCVNKPNAVVCDDGDACTNGDVCAAAQCQGGGKYFAKTYESPITYSGFRAVAALPDGGLALAGFRGPYDPKTQKTGQADGWLMRSDATGKQLWSKTYGGSKTDDFTGMALLPDGGFALAGYTSSNDLPNNPLNGVIGNFWLLRTDFEGKFLWNKTFASGAWQQATGIAALQDGGLAVVGTKWSVGPYQGPGWADFWLVRTDATGNLLWDKAFGGAHAEHAFAILAQEDGGFALAGSTESQYLPQAQTNHGDVDAWLVRTDAAGNLLWNRTYGGANTDYARAMAVAPGGFVLAGVTTSFAENGQNIGLDDPYYNASYGLCSCNIEAWVVRTDSVGNLLWSKHFAASWNNRAIAVASLGDTGFAVGADTGPVLGSSWPDLWLLRTDLDGNLLWNRKFAAGDWDNGNSIAVTADGGVAFAGWSDLKPPAGPVNAGAGGPFVVRTDPWGHASCPDAGACSGKVLAECDGKKPCNVYGCDKKAGCTAAALADTAACSDIQACTIADVCKAGSCQAGVDKLYEKTFGGKEDDYFRAITAMPNGDFVVGGATKSPDTGVYDAWAVRLSAQGVKMGEYFYGDPTEEDEIRALAPRLYNAYDAGKFVFGGFLGSSAALQLCGVDGNSFNGKVSAKMGGKFDGQVDAIVKSTDGFAIAGLQGPSVFVRRVDHNLATTWTKTYTVQPTLQPPALLALADGGLVLSQNSSAINPKAMLLRLDSLGNTLWTYSSGPGFDAFGVAHRLAGGFLLFGNKRLDIDGLNNDPWLAAIDAGGKLLWQATYSTQGTDFLQGAISLQNGNALVLRHWGKDDSLDLLDAVGAPIWQKTLVGISANAIIATADGSYAIVGSKNGDGWFARVDANGYTSCAAAGNCASPVVKDCEDKNPCTADTCDGKLGCLSSNLADGAACGGGKSCKLGACQ